MALTWRCNPADSIALCTAAAGAYIALGFSLCTLVGGQLSHETRLNEPGLFNFLFGIFGFPMVGKG